jgi:hypothetical protein
VSVGNRVLQVCLLGLIVSILGGGVALANGGASIASAPALPIGSSVASGWSSAATGVQGEFWRVQMNAGDKLTLDLTATEETCNTIEIGIYNPSVTDYTLSSSSTTSEIDINAQGQGEFVAPSGGDWTLFFHNPANWCGTASYDFTATVKHRTVARLAGPTDIRVDRRLTLVGMIRGLSNGFVKIQLQLRKHWSTVATVSVRSGGSFRWSTRPHSSGRRRYRVVFAGDGSHLPCSAAYTVLVG